MLASSGVSWYARCSRLTSVTTAAGVPVTPVRARYASTGSAPISNWPWFAVRNPATSAAVRPGPVTGRVPRAT